MNPIQKQWLLDKRWYLLWWGSYLAGGVLAAKIFLVNPILKELRKRNSR